MLSHTFQVILGPRKPFNYRESNLIFYNLLLDKFKKPMLEESLSTTKDNLTHHNKKPASTYTDFLQLSLDHTLTTEGKITSKRIKRLEVALQEISLNIHSYAVNHIVYFVTSLSDLVSDELMTRFMKSDTMFAYERLMTLLSMEDDYLHEQLSGAPLAPGHVSHHTVEYNQMEFERRLQHQRSVRKLMNALREKPPSDEEDLIPMGNNHNEEQDRINAEVLKQETVHYVMQVARGNT